jgi:hypothetical protein
MAFSATPARADLPPWHYQSLQQEAPEVLQIEVIASDAICGHTSGCDYRVEANVLCVARSATLLVPGDVIIIEYHSWTTPDGNDPRIMPPGGRPLPALRSAQRYPAFLQPRQEQRRYRPAAAGASFEVFASRGAAAC